MLSRLPDDILLTIVQHLGNRDARNVSATAIQIYQLRTDLHPIRVCKNLAHFKLIFWSFHPPLLSGSLSNVLFAFLMSFMLTLCMEIDCGLSITIVILPIVYLFLCFAECFTAPHDTITNESGCMGLKSYRQYTVVSLCLMTGVCLCMTVFFVLERGCRLRRLAKHRGMVIL